MKRRRSRLRSAVWLGCTLAPLAVVAAPRPAHALLNAGVEGGLVKRSADSPRNLKLGFGYGLHGELSLLPLLLIGPYYLHDTLDVADAPLDAKDTFNTLGLRARFVLPLPGSDWHPYAYAGLGYSWVSQSATGIASVSGHFFETPIGVGLAYSLLPMFQVSLDGALRPGFGFGGDLYDGLPSGEKPSTGWSLMLGAAIDL